MPGQVKLSHPLIERLCSTGRRLPGLPALDPHHLRALSTGWSRSTRRITPPGTRVRQGRFCRKTSILSERKDGLLNSVSCPPPSRTEIFSAISSRYRLRLGLALTGGIARLETRDSFISVNRGGSTERGPITDACEMELTQRFNSLALKGKAAIARAENIL